MAGKGFIVLQRGTLVSVMTVIRLVHIEGMEIHPSLIECIVDFRYHSFEFHLGGI